MYDSTKLNVISWNVEDFVSIDALYKRHFFLNTLKKQDIILLQEWNNKNDEGAKFIQSLKNSYSYSAVDRVAIIYSELVFDKSRTLFYDIPLVHESPSFVEKSYTSGRQKSNMLSILFPHDNKLLPICAISMHLSAYSPRYHPGFHKKQLTGLLTASLSRIKEVGIKKFGLIVGGDTNYRNVGVNRDDLIGELIPLSYRIIDNNGILKDVCKNKCLHKSTQSFKCVHEKNIAKKTMKFIRNYIYTSKNNKESFIHDNRLDFITTNLAINYNSTKIVSLCDISDHSAVVSQLVWTIPKSMNKYKKAGGGTRKN